MATPNEKLAEALAKLAELQRGGKRVFRSNSLSRVHRERLLQLGFLMPVMRGWLISSSPDNAPGDTTPWYASFWEFCADYCNDRFGDDWVLSAEQSLLLHAANTVIPGQVIINTPKGTRNTVELLFGTSLYDLRQQQMPPKTDVVAHDGLRLFSPEAALIKVPEGFFARHAVEAQVVLEGIRDASDILQRLLDGGHSAVAGRLAGALRRIGRAALADEILKTMKATGYDVRETDPFTRRQAFAAIEPKAAPIVGRLQALWENFRTPVLEIFPQAPGLPRSKKKYLRFVDDIYKNDAYHSLSIEGYRVTPELIERVKAGDRNPDNRENDRQNVDALAARGYWQAFQRVKESVDKVVHGEEPGPLVRADHRDWYRELFQPCVTAGLMSAGTLAGYRNNAVYLRGSRHVPPRWEAVRDAMPALFDLFEQEPEASVRAVLGHWLFGYVHPYPDGNGRMARFTMNVMLASGGYPWTVIRVDDRDAYMSALEAASVDEDIRPFAEFIAGRVQWSMEQAGANERK